MAYVGATLVPVFICVSVCAALLKKLDAFSLFTEGAKNGLRIAAHIAPSMLGLITAVNILSSSGALDALARLISPVTEAVGFPAEVLPLTLLRPVSGGGAVAVLENILAGCGPDSLAGRIASIVCGGGETTFYALAVYFGGAGVKKTSYAIPAALTADFTVSLVAAAVVRLGL
ncbi:MAG: spore maturation protein [Clostridia bacterium]|nr:spore maturation protein [Clostridia bacterium]